MKNLLKSIIVVVFVWGVSGCDMDITNTKKIEALQRENQRLLAVSIAMEANRSSQADKQQQEYQNRENLAKIAMQETVAKLNQAKELEALKLKLSLEKEKLANSQKRKLEQMRLDGIVSQDMREIEQQRYMIALGALLMIIIALFIYLYFKRRREDKLLAYNDNLDKYFRSKENEARVKIAEKILETISSGNLSPSHEAKLIGVFNDQKKSNFQDDKMIDDKKDKEMDDTQDAEIVS